MANQYYRWLYDYIDPREQDSYFILTQILFSIPFKYDIPMDQNREDEIFELQGNFADENPNDEMDIPRFFSVFELMIILARHMEYQDMRDHTTGEVGPYFWELIENLGLRDYTDTYMEHYPESQNEVRDCIVDMMDHNYNPIDGRGSLFPIKRGALDRTTMQLWDQLATYMLSR